MENIFSLFITLLTLLPDMAVLGLSIYYFFSKETVDGLLLCIGSGIGLLLAAFFSLVPIINFELYESLAQSNIFIITSVLGFTSSACFAVGFGMLVLGIIDQKKK